MSANRDYVAYRLAQLGLPPRRQAPKRSHLTMSWERAEQLRHDYYTKRVKQQALAQQYGIGQATVHRILTGKSWTRRPWLRLCDVRSRKYWTAFLSRCVDEARAQP